MTEQPLPDSVPQLIGAVRAGDPGAADRLFQLAYAELRSLAGHLFRGQRTEHTLQPTALVHEAWLKMRQGLDGVEDRLHFFRLAAKAMRQVLADHARSQRRLKRGGDATRATVSLDQTPAPGESGQALDLVDFDDSLRRLEELNERHARVVELRMFGALTIDETARVLGVSHGTIESDWTLARAWLRRELHRG
jgi:RNA polymerase sigma-70 factor (ECF subfamily)